MTLVERYNLSEAINEAIEKTNNGSTRDVIRYLQTHHRKTLDENSLTIEGIGLGNLIRAYRKKPTHKDTYTKIANLCLDFGLQYMDLDDEISVPIDLTNLLNSECDWPDLDDATVDDLDKHLLLRDAQASAHSARTRCLRILRQAAAAIVPDRTDIPIRELRQLARARRAG